MSRLVARPFLFAVLGAALVFLSPVASQAATSAAAGTVPRAVATGNKVLIGWVFTGYTYPDTSAGLAACDAKGQSLLNQYVTHYMCPLSDPDAGVYNLWVYHHVIT